MKRFLFLTLFISINHAIALHIDCNYGIFDSQHAYGDKYRCLVNNVIDIDLSEDVYIETLTGTHMSGKSDDSDVHFHLSGSQIQYFPRGLEKFYKNLKGIVIWHSKLKEVHQDDLKPYPSLNNLYLSGNLIEIIEDGLFDYNPDIEVIIFENTKLFHIGASVFNHLAMLKTLFFNGNVCTNLSSIQDQAVTLKVIKGIKKTCTSSDFVSMKKKLDNLEELSVNSVIASSPVFSQNVINFQTEFKNSKFAGFSPLKQKFQQLIEQKIKSHQGDEVHIEDIQRNLLKAVDSKIEDLESRMTRKLEELLDEKLEKVMINIKKIIAML